MTKVSPIEERRELQEIMKKLRPRLAKAKKTRELARRLGIHPNTISNYLDGYCNNTDIMRSIQKESAVILNDK